MTFSQLAIAAVAAITIILHSVGLRRLSQRVFLPAHAAIFVGWRGVFRAWRRGLL